MSADSRIPFLIWTDAPDKGTGLARICRDIASHMQADPVINQLFRVGTCGFFGSGSSRFPWPQYMSVSVEDALHKLPTMWTDFRGSYRGAGVLFTITPPTWIFPLGCPDLAALEKPQMKETWDWLNARPFEIWSYLAIESHSPNFRYSLSTIKLMESLDRRLYYSKWGAQIAANCMSKGSPFQYLTHGIFTDTFIPPPASKRAMVRASFEMTPDDYLIGCVATNTQRKNLGLLFEAYALCRQAKMKGKVHLWLHTDVGLREWSLPALLGDLGIADDRTEVHVTSTLQGRSDTWMAEMLGACDVFTLPTEGEGFGYPLVEALSCGTPIVTGTFGAQTQFVEDFKPEWLVPYVSLNVAGINNLMRPAYRPDQYANTLMAVIQQVRTDPTLRAACRDRAKLWDWSIVWPDWRNWLLAGVPDSNPLKPKPAIEEIKETSDDSIAKLLPFTPSPTGLPDPGGDDDHG